MRNDSNTIWSERSHCICFCYWIKHTKYRIYMHRIIYCIFSKYISNISEYELIKQSQYTGSNCVYVRVRVTHNEFFVHLYFGFVFYVLIYSPFRSYVLIYTPNPHKKAQIRIIRDNTKEHTWVCSPNASSTYKEENQYKNIATTQ